MPTRNRPSRNPTHPSRLARGWTRTRRSKSALSQQYPSASIASAQSDPQAEKFLQQQADEDQRHYHQHR